MLPSIKYNSKEVLIMHTQSIPNRICLEERQLPTAFYNLRSAMETPPAPLLNPANLEPCKPHELYSIFIKELANQELDCKTPYFDIPGPVMDFYRMYRPSPLARAYNLEKALDTPARIYYKFEGNNTSGSHKLNSAAPQAYYAKAEGLEALTTETGAGQWGTALAEACAFFGLPLTVYMVKASAAQKPFRRTVMETFGAGVVPSPSATTAAGRRILAEHPGTGGSLGCAISEAVEAAGPSGVKYALGSVLNYVLLHQSIIGLEAETALRMIDEYPDVIVGCAGGGSNLGGLIAPFMRDKLAGHTNPDIVAVEPLSCPSLTRGRFAYDYCDTGRITPLAKMYTLGSGFIPAPTHAGGLRYHGMSPIISQLYSDGHLRAIAAPQQAVFESAMLFARLETILPAPESAHAIYGAVQEAIACRESGRSKAILFGLTGTGYFDLTAYERFNRGTLADCAPSDAELEAAFAALPAVK